MPTPKELTAAAVAMGVAGVDLNTIAFAMVDDMEASGEYFGPYDSRQRAYLEQYLIEEITPDRIENSRIWLSTYVPPTLQTLTISNSQFYAQDGSGTYIGTMAGMTPGSVVSTEDSRVVIDSANNVYIGLVQTSEIVFSVSFYEELEGAIGSPRITNIQFSAITNLTDYAFVTDDNGAFLTDDFGVFLLAPMGTL